MEKEKHIWSAQIMNELLERASSYEYNDSGRKLPPLSSPTDADVGVYEIVPFVLDQGGAVTLSNINKEQQPSSLEKARRQKNGAQKDKGIKKETHILMAAKNGVTEMVEKILQLFSVAVHDVDAEKKNIVLLAIENRQPHTCKFFLKRNIMKESLFRKVDDQENSALHLAAKLGDYKSWLIRGAVFQMQWEIKWYDFVKDSMAEQFFARYNNNNKTPKDIFTETHTDLVQQGTWWLQSTCSSCSVVTVFIAGVSFASCTTVPEGNNDQTGKPTLEGHAAFNVFVISSLVALSFSVTQLVIFLTILTSRNQQSDFRRRLPLMLLLALSSLFVSIASTLVSFCAANFFLLKDKLSTGVYVIYITTCLPVSFYAIAQFPLYWDLLTAILTDVLKPSYRDDDDL